MIVCFLAEYGQVKKLPKGHYFTRIASDDSLSNTDLRVDGTYLILEIESTTKSQSQRFTFRESSRNKHFEPNK